MTMSNTEAERLLGQVVGDLNPFTAFLHDTAAELRHLRETAGLSQRALADRMCTTQNQVWLMETQPGVAIQLRSIYAFADALGYDTFVVFHPRALETGTP